MCQLTSGTNVYFSVNLAYANVITLVQSDKCSKANLKHTIQYKIK